MVSITLQISPPLKVSGLCVKSCQISDSLEFHVSNALLDFERSSYHFPSSIHLPVVSIYRQGEQHSVCSPAVLLISDYTMIKSKISFAKVMMTPPAKVKNPFALWLGSCDFKDKPICTTPNPNKIKPIARIKEKIKSDKLFTTANGSPAARTGVVHHIMANTITA